MFVVAATCGKSGCGGGDCSRDSCRGKVRGTFKSKCRSCTFYYTCTFGVLLYSKCPQSCDCFDDNAGGCGEFTYFYLSSSCPGVAHKARIRFQQLYMSCGSPCCWALCHSMSLYVTLCHSMSLYVTLCQHCVNIL